MKSKKTIVLLLIILLPTLWLCLSASDFSGQNVYKIVLPDTELFAEPSFSGVVTAVMPQNAEITLIEESFLKDGFTWQKIEYNTIQGYALSSSLYLSKDKKEYTFVHARAKSDKIGEPVKLFISNSEDSEIALTINDGEKLDIIEDKVDYGDFYKIDYQDGKYFVKKANATTSLSTNQTLAIILIAITIAVTAASLTVYFIKRRKKEQK